MPHHHFAARQQNCRGHVSAAVLAHERRVLGAPHAGGMMHGVFERKRAHHARSAGMHAHRGDAQRFSAVRSHDFNADSMSERQPLAQSVGNQRAQDAHGCMSPENPGCPGTLPPRIAIPGYGGIAACDQASSYQRKTSMDRGDFCGSNNLIVAPAVRTTSEYVPSARRKRALARSV